LALLAFWQAVAHSGEKCGLEAPVNLGPTTGVQRLISTGSVVYPL